MKIFSNDATFFSAFVHSHISLEEKNATLGKIVTSDGDEIATYTKVSENIVNCNVNERLLTPNDFNKFANVFCDAVAQETKIIIFHSKTEPMMSQFGDNSIIRCLKSTARNTGNFGFTLEQPNVIGGVSAAGSYLSSLKFGKYCIFLRSYKIVSFIKTLRVQ